MTSSVAAFQLTIRTPDGKTRVVPLINDRLSLGRSASSDVSFPEDSGLSRQHMIFERQGAQWTIEDSGSKNGTLVNGARITARHPLRPGDRIAAGHLTIDYAPHSGMSGNTVVFVDHAGAPSIETTIAATVKEGSRQVSALIRASEELAGQRPLAELFEVIMDLSLEAVRSRRGVLMALEGGELVVKAARGDGFQISSAVRDRVINQGTAVLVVDALSDAAFRERASIVAQNVRSMIAVPLQAKDQVIGLIYVDSPGFSQPFTRDDLNLLTVMARVAAIRIENVRLAEVEQASRVMAAELEQAARIQQGLLPAAPPAVAGLDIAGATIACHTVGGDYYDYLSYPDGRVGVIVGDVAGKGMPASLMMSSLQARVHVLFEDSQNVAASVTRLNRAVARNCPDNRFITFFTGSIDPSTGEVISTNAGHNPPLLVRSSGEVESLKDGGIILGIMAAFQFKQVRSEMHPGDVLVMFSDGVTESWRAGSDEEFGEERLIGVVREHATEPATAIAQAVLDAVRVFSQGAPQSDDITVVIVKRDILKS